MEIESISVICLIALVVLIVQIIVTLRLFLYLHMSHEKDEEYGLRTVVTEPQPGSVQEVQPLSSHNPEVPTVPGPAYPTSSRYSVRTDISDSSYGSGRRAPPRAPHAWDGTSPADRRKGLKVFHSDSGSESGILSCDPMGRIAKKQNIVTEL